MAQVQSLGDSNLKAFIDNMTDTIWVIDTHYRLVMANTAYRKSMANLLGHEVVDGSSVLSDIPSILVDKWKPRYDRALAGEAFSQEIDSGSNYLSSSYRDVSFNPICSPDGSVTGVACFSQDITTRKQAELNERSHSELAVALQTTATILNSTLDFDEVLERILMAAGQVLPHDAANIMLIDQATGLVKVQRHQGYEQFGVGPWTSSLAFQIADAPNLERLLSHPQPLVIADTQADPEWLSFPETRWIRSYACVPICVRGQVVGFLNLDSSQSNFFSKSSTDRMQAFADQIAVAIQNSRMYADLQIRARQMGLLYEASASLAQCQTMAELHTSLLTRAVKLVEADTATLSSFEDSASLKVIAVLNLPEQLVGQSVASTSDLVMQAARTFKVQKARNRSVLAIQPFLPAEVQSGSLVVVPLMWQNRLVAVLGVGDHDERDFSAEEVHLLELFAPVAAAAIEHQRALELVLQREADAKQLAQLLVTAQEDERARIAALLQDSLSPQLTLLQQGLEVQNLKRRSPTALLRRDQLNRKLLGEVQQSVQQLAVDLNTQLLIEAGLTVAIQRYCDQMTATVGIPIEVRVIGSSHRLAIDLEQLIFQGLQAIVLNSLRQAQVQHLSVQLHYGAERIRLIVQVVSRGWTLRAAGQSAAHELADLRQHAKLRGGEFTMENIPDEGLTATLQLPLEIPRSKSLRKYRVMVVDEFALLRQGVRNLLQDDPELVFAGEAANSTTALSLINQSQPDLIIVSIDLPGLNGIAVTRQVVHRFPRLCVVILTYHREIGYLQEALQAGARGYLLTSDDNVTIRAALSAVLAGEISISPQLIEAWQLLQQEPPTGNLTKQLTRREYEVMQLIGVGQSRQQIAEELGISIRTVDVHRRNLMAKLSLKNIAELIKFSIQKFMI